MSYPINYPTPQNADVQIFTNTNTLKGVDWVKPQGATMVWFTLIGAGGNGDGSSPGGSGAVTNCMIPAFFIPNILRVCVGSGGVGSYIYYQEKTAAGYILLVANPGSAGGYGSSSSPSVFSSAGLFQSVQGTLATTTPSPTTFLSGGITGSATIQANYGYSKPSSGTDGYFQTQPIIVGTGASGSSAEKGGIGCGGNFSSNSKGGNGMVVIISW